MSATSPRSCARPWRSSRSSRRRGWRSLLNPLSWRARRRIRSTGDFRIDNGRLNVADAEVFKRDPVNLIRFFARAEETGAFFHPDAVRLLRRSLRLIDDKLRNDAEANRIFLDMLCSDKNPEATLRRMNEAGVLGRFVPEFGKVVSMMQFNMYHHYTVDEHLIRTVGMLSDIEHGMAAEPHPLSTSIFKTIQNRRALYVAAFLHDIAKGRTEDHSLVGARIARALCPRFGMSAAETETVAWLVEHHLLMSADRLQPRHRRPQDHPRLRRRRAEPRAPETAADADGGRHPRRRPQRLERLEGPAAARPLLRDRAGGGRRAHPARLARSRRRGPGRLPRRRRRLARRGGRSASSSRHYPDYWLRTETRKVVEHAKLIRGAEQTGEKLASRLHHRRLHGHHRAVAVRAQPPPAAGAVCRRLRRLRRQHLGRTHLDHARRLRARHLPAGARVRPGRGRAAPRAAHRRDHREAAQGRDQAQRADGQAARAAGPARRLHGGARGARRQRASPTSSR